MAQARIEPVSRRTVNLSYALWVLAVSVALLASFVLIDLFCYRLQPSLIHSAVNTNPLATFIIANLSTGLVNLSVQTIHQSDVVALGILAVYMGLVSAAVVGLAAHGVRLR